MPRRRRNNHPCATHTYDGKLDQEVIDHINRLGYKSLSLKEKQDKAYDLLMMLSDRKAIRILNGIIGKLGSHKNYENTNGLQIDDLICVCWTLRHNTDFMTLFEIQLNETTGGNCVQGRCHRLFQLICAYITYIQPNDIPE